MLTMSIHVLVDNINATLKFMSQTVVGYSLFVRKVSVMEVSLIFCSLLAVSLIQGQAVVTIDETTRGISSDVASNQLNCTTNQRICQSVCNESKDLPYSSTFCDRESGSCVCDCRDTIPKKCEMTPFTPCFQDCVRKNPNPNVYLYEGGNCPIPEQNGTILHQCACECSLREDYVETNDLF